MSDGFRRILAWSMLAVGVVGFLVTFPLWLLGLISDRTMLGLTLALSWAALWFEAANALQLAHNGKETS